MTRRGEAGAVLPLVALCVAVLMGFGGMAVDIGYWEYQQREQQSAADGAAVGAAQQLAYSGCPNQSVAKTTAQSDAARNGFTDDGNLVKVVVNNPPQSGPFASDNCAVDVQITTKGVSAWFSKFFGISNGATETTEAVGTLTATSGSSPCIWLLNTTTQNDLSNSHITAPNCAIVMNESANMSGATIEAAKIGYAQGTNNVSGATFTGASPASILPVADPCAEMSGCANLAANPPSVSSCGAGGTYQNVTLQPGCYSTLTLSGTDTLASGTYIVNGQFHVNGATVTGANVTIYLTANASDTNFSNANLNISAPTSGNDVGVALYRPGSQSAAVDMSTCACAFTGLVYLPTSKVNFSNTGNSYTLLVAGQGNLSNSASLDFATPPPGVGVVKQAVLGE